MLQIWSNCSYTRDCPFRVASRENKIPVTAASAPTPKGATSFGSNSGQNRLYAFTTRQESEASHDVVISMLKVFSHDVYYMIDLGSTLSYVPPFMALHFGFCHECILDLFSVFTTIGDFIVARNFIRVVRCLLVVEKLW